MTKYLKIQACLLSLFMTLGLNACKEASQPDEQSNTASSQAVDHSTMDHSQMKHDQHQGMNHSQHESMDAGKPSDMSLYHMTATWTNQEAQPVQLKDLNGKIQLIAMVYSSCQNACPRIIADMKQIEAEVQEKYKGKVNLILVSIDPEVDTPEKLKALAEKSQLTQNWHLLRGESDDVLELAALLGVKYKKISDTDYAHSNIISVLNLEGEIVHQQEGLGVEPEDTLKAIEGLLSS